ncbi:MAG: MTH1187 family thiamine-binding protein [Planctomycetaceae bacterium]|nr:MTH1187 family thiamine-binding protein [Planctomycetaceae bacterium]
MNATAEIQVIPIGAGVSVRREAQRAHELLQQSGLILETHASGTDVEGDLSQILHAVERVHAVLHAEGTVRLLTVVKLETRTDKVPTLAGKRL